MPSARFISSSSWSILSAPSSAAISSDRLGLAVPSAIDSASARLESAENRVKLRTLMTNERVDEALTRFDQLERRVDYAEGRADALSIADGTGKPTLSDEIAALEGADKIDEELEEMKRALGMGDGDKKGE